VKKLLPISFALLILFTGIHFTVATHYCGGKLAASKVSFSGELASCDMEGLVDECFIHGNHLNLNCCNNKVSAFAVDYFYAPSFSEITTFAQHILQIFILPAYKVGHSLIAINLISTDVSPPDNFLVSAVSLPKICVFII